MSKMPVRQKSWDEAAETMRHEHPDVRAFAEGAMARHPNPRCETWIYTDLGPVRITMADGSMREGCHLVVYYPVPSGSQHDMPIVVLNAMERYGLGVFERSGARVHAPIDEAATLATLFAAGPFGNGPSGLDA